MKLKMYLSRTRLSLLCAFVVLTITLNTTGLSGQSVSIYYLGPADLTTNNNFWEVWQIHSFGNAGDNTTWARIATGDRPCGSGGAIPRTAWGYNTSTNQGYHLYAAGSNPNCDYSGYIRYRRDMVTGADFYLDWAINRYNPNLTSADFSEFTLEFIYGIPTMNSSDYFKVYNVYGSNKVELFSTNQETGSIGSTYNFVTKTYTIQPSAYTHYIQFYFESNYGALSTAKEGPYISSVTLTGKLKPKISITPVSKVFGDVEVSSCGTDQSFEIKNIGGGTATGSVSLSGTNSNQFNITSGSGSYSLTANQTKIVNVKFCPTSTGTQNASLNVTGTNTNSESSSLTGNGVYFSVSSTSLSIGSASGSTGNISFNSNASWSVSDDATWLSVNPSSGSGTGSVTVTASSANPTINPRNSTVTFSPVGAGSKTVTVTQAGLTPVLTITPTNKDVTALAGTTSFVVTSNIPWTASSNQSWCTVNPSGSGNGTITATYSINNSTDTRTATITVSGTGVSSKSVTVTQAGTAPILSVTPSNQNVTEASGTAAFYVLSNISWTATSNQTWCTVTPSGNGNGTITATYTANLNTSARTATITVSGNGAGSLNVTVTQGGPPPALSVAPSNQGVTAISGTTPFTVTSNIAWTATSNQTWCTVTPSGTGNGTITATYTANTGAASRTATITVAGSGVSNQTVTVTQLGTTPTLSVTPSNQSVTAASGTTTFSVASNIAWTATSNQSWCTITPSGNGNGTITATYTANTGASSRTATITVSGAGVSNQSVTVTQSAPGSSLTVTPSNQGVTAAPGTTTFTISSTVAWTATSNQTWCSITPSGNGNGTITATYTANTGASSRTATITVSGTGVSNQIVTVTQSASGSSLTVTPSNQGVTAASGTTTFTISSTVAWTATSNQAWCTITPSGNGNGTITATYTANTGASVRTATITVSGTGVSNQSVTVTQSAPGSSLKAPTIDAIYQPTCSRATGTVYLNDLPGTGTWTLTRTPDGITKSGTGTTTTVYGLGAGTYNFYVTSSTGVVSALSDNVIINPQPLKPSAPVIGTVIQPTCTEPNGSITLNGLPSSGEWTLQRSGVDYLTGTGTTAELNDLEPGTYRFSVTSSSGCTSAAAASITINTVLTPLPPTIVTITQPTCSMATGSVMLKDLPASGTWTLAGTPGEIAKTGTGTTVTIPGLLAGSYTFTVTNSSGCISGATDNILINAQPSKSATPSIGAITQPTCDVSTGSVILNNLPSTGTWTINRTPGSVTTTGTGTTMKISGISTGTYKFTVSVTTGCNSEFSGDVIINAQPLTPVTPVIETITQPTCITKSGSVTINGLPSTGTWILKTISGETLVNGAGVSAVLSNLSSGTFGFKVTNEAGCTSQSSEPVTVNVPETGVIPVIKIKWDDILICINKGESITSYKWYMNDSAIPGATGKYYETKKAAGVYRVETKDTRGCINLSNVISIVDGKSITAYPNPASVSFGIELRNIEGKRAVISILNSNGRKVMEYQIEKITDDSIKEIPVESLSEGAYFVYLLVDNTELYFTKVLVIK